MPLTRAHSLVAGCLLVLGGLAPHAFAEIPEHFDRDGVPDTITLVSPLRSHRQVTFSGPDRLVMLSFRSICRRSLLRMWTATASPISPARRSAEGCWSGRILAVSDSSVCDVPSFRASLRANLAPSCWSQEGIVSATTHRAMVSLWRLRQGTTSTLICRASLLFLRLRSRRFVPG